MERRISASSVRKRQEEMHGGKYTKDQIINKVMDKIMDQGLHGSAYSSDYVAINIPYHKISQKGLRKAKAALKRMGYRVTINDYALSSTQYKELEVSWAKFDWGLFWVRNKKTIQYTIWVSIFSLVYLASLILWFVL